MITRTHISLHLYGQDFSPYKLSELTGVSLSEVKEKGVTLITRGRYRGQIAPSGSASLSRVLGLGDDVVGYNVALNELLLKFHDDVFEKIGECGVDRMTLWISFVFDYDGQLGLEFTPENMSLLGKMKIPICINLDRYE